MALAGTGNEPMRSEYIFGWAIKMQSDDGKVVRVLVTDEALERIASPPKSGIERLREYRARMEDIASTKHTAGRIEADGTVKVTSADV
jgi:hypothetical protein